LRQEVFVQHLQVHPPRHFRGVFEEWKAAGPRLRSKIEHAVVTLVLAQFHSSSATVEKMD